MSDSIQKSVVVLGRNSKPPRIPAGWLELADTHPDASIALETRDIANPAQLKGCMGVIHLDSAGELAGHRAPTFEKMSEWVRLFARHALFLPEALADLPPETQDQLGKDLAVLASCREDDFMILSGQRIDQSLLMASIKLWAAPKVRLQITKHPLERPYGPNQEVFQKLLNWVVQKP